MEVIELTKTDIIANRIETVHRSARKNMGYMYPFIDKHGESLLFCDPINRLICKRRLVLPGYRTKFSIPYYHRVFPDLNTMIGFIQANMGEKTDAYLKRIENYYKVNIVKDVDIPPFSDYIAKGSTMTVGTYFSSYKEYEVDEQFYEHVEDFQEAFDKVSREMLKNHAKILATRKIRGNASKLYHTFEPGWYKVYEDRVRKAVPEQILGVTLAHGNYIRKFSPNKAVDVYFYREVDGEVKKYWKGLNDLFNEAQMKDIKEWMDPSKCVIKISSNAAIQIKKVSMK